MRKWLDSPKHIFAALRVASVLAILAGVWLSLSSGVLPMLPEHPLKAAIALVNCALWVWAWGSFLGMCTRLMGGPAFTAENSRTLRVIGGCVMAMALLMCLRALPELVTRPDIFLLIEAVVLPGTFLTVGAIALILSSLLNRVMALEEEQEGVV